MSMEQNQFLLLNLARREATYGTAISPLSTWYRLLESDLIGHEREYQDDADEIKGYQYPTEDSEIETGASSGGPINFKMCTELFTYFLGAALGNMADAGAGPSYTHTCTPPGVSVQNPWSIGAVVAQNRGNTATFYRYDGLVVESIEFTIDEVGFVTTNVQLIGAGNPTAVPATGVPDIGTAVEGTRLYFKDTKLLFGALGTEDIITQKLFRKATFKLTNQFEKVIQPATAPNVTEIVYSKGQNPLVEVELVLKGERGGTLWNLWHNRTKCIMEFQLYKDADNYIKFSASAVKIKSDARPESYDETGAILTFPLMFQWDTTDETPWTWETSDSQAAYLATS